MSERVALVVDALPRDLRQRLQGQGFQEAGVRQPADDLVALPVRVGIGDVRDVAPADRQVVVRAAPPERTLADVERRAPQAEMMPLRERADGDGPVHVLAPAVKTVVVHRRERRERLAVEPFLDARREGAPHRGRNFGPARVGQRRAHGGGGADEDQVQRVARRAEAARVAARQQRRGLRPVGDRPRHRRIRLRSEPVRAQQQEDRRQREDEFLRIRFHVSRSCGGRGWGPCGSRPGAR